MKAKYRRYLKIELNERINYKKDMKDIFSQSKNILKLCININEFGAGILKAKLKNERKERKLKFPYSD